MIFVTVGSHHQPFDRLVRACAELAELERVVVQRGPSATRPSGCEVHDWLEPHAFEALLAEARLVVCHAGPATLEAVVRAGSIPLVVPRRRLWREHVDDHQVAWAHRIRDRVHVVDDPADLVDAVSAHEDVVAGLANPWRTTEPTGWVQALDAAAARLLR